MISVNFDYALKSERLVLGLGLWLTLVVWETVAYQTIGIKQRQVPADYARYIYCQGKHQIIVCRQGYRAIIFGRKRILIYSLSITGEEQIAMYNLINI